MNDVISLPTVFLVGVGSTNLLKNEGVKMALWSLGIRHFERVALGTASGVNEQPIGEEEAYKGALNRALAVRAAHPTSYAIGIENALRLVNGVWEDFACIVVIRPNGEIISVESETVVFPTEIVEEAKRRGFKTTTAGSVLAERMDVQKDDQHGFLSGGKKTRQTILQKALTEALSIAILNEMHLSIEGIDRKFILPVTRVSPTMSVALFNPAGKWQINELIGKALAEKVPAGVQVIVCPDGSKVQGLLHVLGREANLPTILARKDEKYLKQPTTSEVRGSSRTTGEAQYFFLGADQVEAIDGMNVMVYDDVISTGESIEIACRLIAKAGGRVVATMSALTEGKRRNDVIALGHLPILHF